MIDGYWQIYIVQNTSLPSELSVHTETLNTIEIPSVPYPPSALSSIIVFKSDKMGDGDVSLGEILLMGYINTLTELDSFPDTMIFYNSGVFLCSDTSPVLSILIILLSKGVKIYICGACVDFYELKGKISIGTITNMYAISEMLSKCDKVVYP
jgi:selenium metabolism protein YedF